MAKPLRSQLNQIRAWVRQGRTDAWIAHQLEVSAAELREFRRRHGLSPDEEGAEELDLRDEIEAEIEATMSAQAAEEAEAEAEAEAEEAEAEDETEDEGEAEAGDGAQARPRERERLAEHEGEDGEGEGGERRRRRRRRRGGRRRRRRDRGASSLEATFDHGEADGYGLWLDPAVQDDPVYAEHWAGHRKVEVTLEPDRIVIKRSE